MDRPPASSKTFERCPECEYQLPNHSYSCSIRKRIGRRDFLKKAGAIGAIAGVGGAGFLLGQANAIPAPSIGSTVEPGSMQVEASYIIYLDGSTCLARNGATGVNDYSNSNAATVIQNAINNLPTGGLIILKGGNYSIASPLTIANSNVKIIGESQKTVVIVTQTNTDGFVFKPPVNQAITNCYIGSLNVTEFDTGGSGRCIAFDNAVTYSKIENCYLQFGKYGIDLNGGTGTNRGTRTIVSGVQCNSQGNAGIHLSQQDNATLYGDFVHNTVGNAYVIENQSQGTVMDSERADFPSAACLLIVNSQILKIQKAVFSSAGTYGIYMAGANWAITIEDSYIEASNSEQIRMDNAFGFNNENIKILNSILVRGKTYGINSNPTSPLANLDILIRGNSVVNNSQNGSSTYWGIVTFASGTAKTANLRILDNFVGDSNLAGGSLFQNGIQINGSLDTKILLKNNDVSTVPFAGNLIQITPIAETTAIDNPGYNPQAVSGLLTAGASPYTVPPQPYPYIFLLQAANGITAATLDGIPVPITINQPILVYPRHTLILTWSTTAPTFKELPH